MDADEFAEKAVGLHERVARAVMATCGDRALSEECAAEALLRSWEKVEAGDELRSLEGWTMTVAINVCRSRVRRMGAERRALERFHATESPAATVGSHDDTDDRRPAEHVMAAVLSLPERQREVVALHYLEDMSTAEIAEIVGSTPNAVRNALHHARTTLACVLAPPAGTTDEAEQEVQR